MFNQERGHLRDMGGAEVRWPTLGLWASQTARRARASRGVLLQQLEQSDTICTENKRKHFMAFYFALLWFSWIGSPVAYAVQWLCGHSWPWTSVLCFHDPTAGLTGVCQRICLENTFSKFMHPSTCLLWVWVCSCHYESVEVRGQAWGVGLSSMRPWGCNWTCQAWQQVPFPAEPSSSPQETRAGGLRV